MVRVQEAGVLGASVGVVLASLEWEQEAPQDLQEHLVERVEALGAVPELR